MKTVSDSEVTFTQVVFPKDTDDLGHAPAGYVLKLIDIVASFSARRHTEMNQVTASLDVMNFANPITQWDLVSATARVTQVWNTSLEIQVTVLSQDYKTLESRQIAQGFLTFVSLNSEMRPSKCPSIVFTTEAERLMAQTADLRRQYRMLERQQSKDRSDIALNERDTPLLLTRLMTPDDANVYQNVFGGVILESTHEAARQAAVAHAKTHVTTVRQDRMNFEQPAVIGEVLEARAVLTRTWSSSIETMIEVYARQNTDNAPWRLIANSYLVFVALDEAGHPKVIPKYEPATERQKKRWEEAETRRFTRLSEIKTQKAYQPE